MKIRVLPHFAAVLLFCFLSPMAILAQADASSQSVHDVRKQLDELREQMNKLQTRLNELEASKPAETGTPSTASSSQQEGTIQATQIGRAHV